MTQKKIVRNASGSNVASAGTVKFDGELVDVIAEGMPIDRGQPVVVLGLPRGGVPVASEVAAALEAPLDVIVVRKLGVPFQPELGMGASFLSPTGKVLDMPRHVFYDLAEWSKIHAVYGAPATEGVA